MSRLIRQAIAIIILTAFITTSVKSPAYAQMADDQMPRLPPPGVMVHLSQAYTPAIIRGMIIDPKDPFAFSFLVDPGADKTPADQQKEYFRKLIKYFLAAMTIAEDKQWVNLSPYEHNRIIDKDFGKTQMGRDLLAQDYILKQITASLLYPNEALGKKFWQEVYAQAYQKYGTTQIPVNTFNKVWILPDTAYVYEKDNTVLIVQSHLKVMLDEDYLATIKNRSQPGDIFQRRCPQADCRAIEALNVKASEGENVTRNIMRQIILPSLEKEVNTGKNFAQLRQIYQGMVLATWYKQALKKSILTQIYANKDKVKGVDLEYPYRAQQRIYKQYLKAFKAGAYNFIKEEIDPVTQEIIPRKYFSGGFVRGANPAMMVKPASLAMVKRAFNETGVFRNGAIKALVLVSALMLPSTAFGQKPSVNSWEGLKLKMGLNQNSLIIPAGPRHKITSFYDGTKVVPAHPSNIENNKDKATIAQQRDSNDNDAAMLSGVRTGWADELLKARNFILQRDQNFVGAAIIIKKARSKIWNTQGRYYGLQGLIDLYINTPAYDWYIGQDGKIHTKEPAFKPGLGDFVKTKSTQRKSLPTVLDQLMMPGTESISVAEFEGIRDQIDALFILDNEYANRVILSVLENRPFVINTAEGRPERYIRDNLLNEDGKGLRDVVRYVIIRGYGKFYTYRWRVKKINIRLIIKDAQGGQIYTRTDVAYHVLKRLMDLSNNKFKKEYFQQIVPKAHQDQVFSRYEIQTFGDEFFFQQGHFKGRMLNDVQGIVKAFTVKSRKTYTIAAPGQRRDAAMNVMAMGGYKARISGDKLTLTDEDQSKLLQAIQGSFDRVGHDYTYKCFQFALTLALKIRKQIPGAMTSLLYANQLPEHNGRTELTNHFVTYVVFNGQHIAIDLTSRGYTDNAIDLEIVTASSKGALLQHLNDVYGGNWISDYTAYRTVGIGPNQKKDVSEINVNGQTIRLPDYLLKRISVIVGQRLTLEGVLTNYFVAGDNVKFVFATEDDNAEKYETEIPVSLKSIMNIEEINDKAQIHGSKNEEETNLTKGGIDFNSVNLNLQIKRDGKGVPLPLAQQDLARFNGIQGFEPEIIEIKPASNIPLLSELQQQLQTS